MNAPLVSIVIANYNYGRYLAESIDSALGQSYPNIEVIVVDDGSTDDSVTIATKYPVRVLQQPNSGVARARNYGAGEAHGELLVFLDADDVLEPKYVERCWALLRTAPRGVAYVYTEAERFGLEAGPIGVRSFDGRALFLGNFIPVTALLRKSAFDAVGGFDPTWPAHEDHELWARLFVSGYSGLFLDAPLFRYRFHGRSRNTLSNNDIDDLQLRLVLQYPRYGYRWMFRHRGAFVRALVRRLRQRRKRSTAANVGSSGVS